MPSHLIRPLYTDGRMPLSLSWTKVIDGVRDGSGGHTLHLGAALNCFPLRRWAGQLYQKGMLDMAASQMVKTSIRHEKRHFVIFVGHIDSKPILFNLLLRKIIEFWN